MCSQAILGKHVGRIITNKSQSVPFDPPKPPLEDKKVALTLSEFTHSQRAQLTMVFFFFFQFYLLLLYVAKTRTWKMK